MQSKFGGYIVTVVLILLILVLGVRMIETKHLTPSLPVPNPDDNPRPPIPPAPPPVVLEPKWTSAPALRAVDSSLGTVLGDIDSHMPAGHIYRDRNKVTWGHETTHGINARLRNQGGERVKLVSGEWFYRPPFNAPIQWHSTNAFYVLGDRACFVDEPDTTIREVADKIPRSLRGLRFQLYLIMQARSWNDTPLYIWDEWVAYTNGAAVRYDLEMEQRSDSVDSMLEFCVYSMCVAHVSDSDDPQLKAFLMWHLDRSLELYQKQKTESATRYWYKFLENEDATKLRWWCIEYFGAEWSSDVLGIGEV